MPEELLKEFLIECHENLDRLDQDFVALERNAHDRERLSSAFRTIHTIKGTCGFLALSKLESVSHAGESLLSQLRDGRLTLDAEITSALLAMVDAIRRILASVEATGEEGAENPSRLVAELERLKAGRRRPAGAPMPAAAELTIEAVEEPRAGEDRRSHDERRAGVPDSSLRVDVGVLDELMNLVGELALVRDQMLDLTATRPGGDVATAAVRLDRVTSGLQDSVMKTRMQPIGHVWGKVPRMARDLAAQCGKLVRVEMDGKHVDLDRTIIDAIKDPLTHAVRNSVGHGIETPAERRALGKSAEGVIRLRAVHEPGGIRIEIADDGAGIDLARVRAKAVERGVLSASQAAGLADRDAARLVFLPGFSTVKTVSHLSGRGVGMDVVRTNVEKIGGRVDIESARGAGTVLRITIPLPAANAQRGSQIAVGPKRPLTNPI
jgi:two-component system chemotaxis sensor kinase CheA